MSKNPYNVQVGQVWIDNDARIRGLRKVRVETVGDTHADCMVINDWDGLACNRPTRIRLDRFKPTSTGYRLDTEADA